MTDSIEIKLTSSEHAYPIEIGAGLLREAGAYLKPLVKNKLAIVTDEAVAANLLPTLTDSLTAAKINFATHIIPPGEASKSFLRLQNLCDWLLEEKIERDDYIVALGGGVVGDLSGFAAAILRRGVNLVQVPTSLLAQVDSSIGGKTGINVAQGKNLIGAFHQPALVLIDTQSLASLPERHIRAGAAEIVKYGLLGLGVENNFLDWLETNAEKLIARDEQALSFAIAQSCHAKAAFVIADEREKGDRALLNLGHTFAHAFETLSGYDDSLLHGEAVALGMQLAFDFSVAQNICPAPDAKNLQNILQKLGLPNKISDVAKTFAPKDIVAAMQQDKKVQGGQLRLILTRGIGDCFICDKTTPDALENFLKNHD